MTEHNSTEQKEKKVLTLQDKAIKFCLFQESTRGGEKSQQQNFFVK